MLIAMSAFALLSYSRPDGSEQFIRSVDAGPVYRFRPDFPDAPSDIYFFTRLDKPAFSRDTTGSMALEVSWCRNDSTLFTETVWYPYGETRVLYRSGVQMASEGPWELLVAVPDAPKGLCGLGVAIITSK